MSTRQPPLTAHDAHMMSRHEGTALDRCSRLFSVMRQPEPLDAERAQRAINRAGDRVLAYATGVLVPAEVLKAALRFLGATPGDLLDGEPSDHAVAA